MLFVFLCGNYLDVLKRFLVVGGSFSMIDVIRTLAIAPVATGAVYLGLIIISGRQGKEKLPWSRILLSSIVALAVIGATLIQTPDYKEALQSIANSALYTGLIAFASMLYRTLKDQHKLFRTLVILFIPVVAYGWYQIVNGYSSVEEAYARSGLTVTIQPLLHPSMVEYQRVFSTMNSSGAYTLVGTTLGLYALIFGFGKGWLLRLAGFIFAIACFWSHIPGAGRTGWGVAILGLITFFIFQKKWLTILTYLFSIVAITLFIFNAEIVGIWLVDQTVEMPSDDFSGRALNMGTFTTRTQGISRWMEDGQYFSWFGLSASTGEASGAHDLIGQIYVTTGIVGLSLSIIFGGAILYFLHKNMLRIQNKDHKKMAAFYLANIFAILLGGIFSGSQLHVFPVNVYFWTIIGLLFQLIMTNKQQYSLDNNSSVIDIHGESANSTNRQQTLSR